MIPHIIVHEISLMNHYNYNLLENEWNELYLRNHSKYAEMYIDDNMKTWYNIDYAMNPNISKQLLQAIMHSERNYIDTCCYYANPNITMNDIDNINHIDWRWLSKNPNITWNDITQHIDKPWDWHEISKKTIITPEIVKSNHYPWSWKGLMMNSSMNWDFLQHCPDKHLYLSESPCVTMKFILEHRDFYWDFKKLSYHKNITFYDIQQHPEFEWDIDNISLNPNITWNQVINHPEFQWNYSNLSMHPNITFNIIQKNTHVDWNWDKVSQNPNIHWDHVHSNPDLRWNYEKLLFNHMTKGKIHWIQTKRLRIIKALQIQRHLRACNLNPVFSLAKRNVLRIYHA